MCRAVWCVSHDVQHAIDHLLIFLHLTSEMVILTYQSISLKSAMPLSMLQPVTDLLHCTLLVGKFGTFIQQYFIYHVMLLAHNQNIYPLCVYGQTKPKPICFLASLSRLLVYYCCAHNNYDGSSQCHAYHQR